LGDLSGVDQITKREQALKIFQIQESKRSKEKPNFKYEK
jgi:hypothetical protein